MPKLSLKSLAIVAALAMPSMAVTTPAHAGGPSYWSANSTCPASTPYLIGYARFTNAPVCTSNLAFALLTKGLELVGYYH